MRKTIAILLLLLCIGLTSCAGKKIVYFNDDDRVFAGNKGQTIIAEYDFVIMSKGKFRETTTVSLSDNGQYKCEKVK